MHPNDFYSIPWIGQSIVSQCKDRFVTVRFNYGLRRHYSAAELKWLQDIHATLRGVQYGSQEQPFFEIHRAYHQYDNPTDLQWYARNGGVEIIPEVSQIYDLDRTDTVIIDLDPKDPAIFSFDDLRGATKVVYAALCTKGSPLMAQFNVEAVKFRFSGNRSFHIYIKLDKPYHFHPLREAVKESLDIAIGMYPSLSYKNLRNRSDYILIDIGALARHRCVRALWSLHHKTGLVCIPVQNIDTFKREEASLDAVRAKGAVQEVF